MRVKEREERGGGGGGEDGGQTACQLRGSCAKRHFSLSVFSLLRSTESDIGLYFAL